MARRIFRETALQRYNERLEKIELPRYATTAWTLLAWLGVILFLLFAALLLAVRLPEYAVGPGIVIDADSPDGNASGTVVALLPAAYGPRLSPGQTAEINLTPISDAVEAAPLRASVITVGPAPLSPATVRARYDLDSATGRLIEGPVAVAVISVDIPIELWLGSVGEVRIEVGSRSLLDLLPGLVAGETG